MPAPNDRPTALRTATAITTQPVDARPRQRRERSETMSTSSESYHSSGTTDSTSPSVADFLSCGSPGGLKLSPDTEHSGMDAQMHSSQSKRVSPSFTAKEHHDDDEGDMILGDPSWRTENLPHAWDSKESEEEEEDHKPSCILLNALHVQDIFELPKYGSKPFDHPKFKPVRLPQQINLRNLNIQQIKYATISDIILYAKHGVGHGVLHVAEQ